MDSCSSGQKKFPFLLHSTEFLLLSVGIPFPFAFLLAISGCRKAGSNTASKIRLFYLMLFNLTLI